MRRGDIGRAAGTMMSAEELFGEKSGSVCAFGTEGRTSRRKHIEAETELAAAVFGVSRKRAQRILASDAIL